MEVDRFDRRWNAGGARGKRARKIDKGRGKQSIESSVRASGRAIAIYGQAPRIKRRAGRRAATRRGRRARIKFHFQKFNNRLRRNNSPADSILRCLIVVLVSAGGRRGGGERERSLSRESRRSVSLRSREAARGGEEGDIIPETNNAANAGHRDGRGRAFGGSMMRSYRRKRIRGGGTRQHRPAGRPAS